jgi:hypothetical protein
MKRQRGWNPDERPEEATLMLFRRREQARLSASGVALLVVLLTLGTGGTAMAAPNAPAPLNPADSASVTVPFTMSWSASTDPSGIAAYNWQVSATSTFAKIVRQNSVTAPATQDAVSGLATGSYFWRVQAISNDFAASPWSTARRFTVTGAGAGLPATPTLNQPRGGTSFHPWESFGMSWSSVPGAVKYRLEASKDSAFPVNGVVFTWESPTPSTEILITTVDRGAYTARVFAVDANGTFSMPSNLINFTIAFNAPIAAPPTLVSPTGGVSDPLPVTFTWNHVINPQSSGYYLQIARDSAFSQIEQDIPFLNGPTYTVVQLPTAGPKFWRVSSFQGAIDTAGTNAQTAWSQTGSFTVPDGPLQVNAIGLARPAPASGQEVWVDLQLNKGAPAGGTTVSLSSSNPQAAPLPASVAVPATHSFTQFRFVTGQVNTQTPVTMTASIGSQSTTQSFTVSPSSLGSLEGMPVRQNSGVALGAIVMLNGQAPAGGAVVSLSSSSPAARPPATVTVPAGVESASFSMPTSQVSTDTPVTITASWRGTSVQASTTLTPQPQPTSITLDPTTTSGSSGSNGRVTAADPRDADITFSLSSSRPDLVQVPSAVIVPQFAAAGGFIISTSAVSTRTLVDISVSGGGKTLTATLTLDPVSSAPPPTTLSTFSLSPSTLAAGSASTGVVTSNQTAPAGGLVVALSSSNTAVATVPQSGTIPAGASSANFPVSTSKSATTRTATITASGGGVTRSVVLTATGPTPATVTLNPASVSGGTSSTGTVTLSRAAPAGGVVVSLSSTDTAVLSVPASVTVAAGSSSRSFTVSTTTGSTDRVAHVVATANGVSQNAALQVTASPAPPPSAPAVSALSLNPSTVAAGASSSGTVTLSSAAPAGGLVVSLSSSSAAATVPASVTVAAGAVNASFTISTSSPGSPTITATGGGASKGAILTVNAAAPPPATDRVTISRAEWKSGALRVDATSSNSSAALKVYVTSTGALLGTVSGGRLETNVASNPGNITVKSSLGGQASRAVTG